MTQADEVNRAQYGKVTLKIFITLLTSGLTYLITTLADQPRIWVSTISVLIGGFTLVVQFLNDFEKRLESVEEKQEVHSTEMQFLVKDGFARTSEVIELFQAMEASALQTDTVVQLVQHATQIGPESPSLVWGFAQAQISRMSQLLKGLSEGGDVSCDGEDRDWILGLTMQVQHTIDAISLSTVDGGGISFDGGFWTSEFGQRYLELQREAMYRGVAIRRIFIHDGPGQTSDPVFLRVYRKQRDLGIHTKVLDRSTIPLTLKNLLFDFIIFDEVISYETTPAARVEETMKPTVIKNNLSLEPQRVKKRIRRFEELWAAAQQELDEP
ncbi:MAG: hypothetical protein JO115_01575 [Pseudonocardiales bacterium]|nr:hypothetical protein [Pseudonocardiales bacterium]